MAEREKCVNGEGRCGGKFRGRLARWKTDRYAASTGAHRYHRKSGSYAPALERLATCRWPPRGLAGEASAVELEAVGGAEDGYGDFFGLEELVGEGLELVAGDRVNGGEDFVE
jgi:hypothetical protein